MFKNVVLVLVILLASTASVTFAQGRLEPTDLKAKTSTTSGLNRARIASGKTLLPEVRQNNIRALFERMINKFEAAEVRLGGLIEKIEARLAGLKEVNPDIDVTQLEADLLLAKTHLENMNTNIENAKVQLENLILSDVPNEEFKELREVISEVKSELQTTHRLLVKIVGNLKSIERRIK